MEAILQLIQKVAKTHELSREQIINLLESVDEQVKQELFAAALKTKQRYFGDKVYLRALIEFSNYCRRDCLYCGLRRSNSRLVRYRLTPQEIRASCQEAYDLGYRSFVLQSGEDMWYSQEVLTELIRELKNGFPGAALTLSIGERTVREYASFFAAGADRFLLRHETASPLIYGKLHPGMNQAERKACLSSLGRIGYQAGAGFMVGLPGQTFGDLADDLLYLQEISPHMAGIGPFIPHPDTPLAQEQGGSVEMTLVVLALARLLLPDCLIPATTALGSLDPVGREKALKAGANVVMPSLTPVKLKQHYALYPGKICLEDEPGACKACMQKRIRESGFEPDFGRGDSPRWHQEPGTRSIRKRVSRGQSP